MKQPVGYYRIICFQPFSVINFNYFAFTTNFFASVCWSVSLGLCKQLLTNFQTIFGREQETID